MGPILETKWVECGASVDTRGIMGESAKCKVRSSGWGDIRSLRTESIQLSMKTNNINKGSTKYILVKVLPYWHPHISSLITDIPIFSNLIPPFWDWLCVIPTFWNCLTVTPSFINLNSKMWGYQTVNSKMGGSNY